jgi:hypothetical protein
LISRSTRIDDYSAGIDTRRYLTNTFGINASGSPRLKTCRGAASVCITRGLLNPSSDPKVVDPVEALNGLRMTS